MGGAGGSTSSSSSSSTGSMPEDCTNGADDDQDGLIDCADPDCDPGFTCTSKVPPAWNGPVAFFEGDSASLPGCTPDHPNEVYTGHTDLVVEPAICSACTCSDPNVICTVQPLSFGDAACVGGGAVQPLPGQCGVLMAQAAVAYKADPPVANVGACTASMVMTTIPPPAWMTGGVACGGGGLGTGCQANEVCSPRPVAPFGASLCIYKAGDSQCPPSYPNKHVFDDNVVDTRGCGQCTCGVGSGTCNATSKVYSAAMCGGSSTTVPNNGVCTAGAGGVSMDVTVTKSGSCPPGGGMPTGTVVPGVIKTTVCCAQ